MCDNNWHSLILILFLKKRYASLEFNFYALVIANEGSLKRSCGLLDFRLEITFIWFLKDMKRHIGLSFHWSFASWFWNNIDLSWLRIQTTLKLIINWWIFRKIQFEIPSEKPKLNFVRIVQMSNMPRSKFIGHGFPMFQSPKSSKRVNFGPKMTPNDDEYRVLTCSGIVWLTSESGIS